MLFHRFIFIQRRSCSEDICKPCWEKKNTQIGEIATEPPPLKNVKEIIKYIVQYENFVERKAVPCKMNEGLSEAFEFSPDSL